VYILNTYDILQLHLHPSTLLRCRYNIHSICSMHLK